MALYTQREPHYDRIPNYISRLVLENEQYSKFRAMYYGLKLTEKGGNMIKENHNEMVVMFISQVRKFYILNLQNE